MKRFLFLMFAFFMALCVPVFGQDGGSEPSFSWGFGSFAALVAVIPVVTEFLKNAIKPPAGLWTQVISWVTGIAITFAVWLAGLGFLAGVPWWQMLLYGFGASLVANGIFDTGIITSIFGLFGTKD